MNIAKKLSDKSDHEQFKIGCLAVKKNKIISLGFNKTKTNTHSNTPWKTTHAELNVLLSADKEELKDSTIYLYRQNKKGGLAMSRSCQYCQELLKLAGIKKMCYSTPYGYVEEEI